MYFRELDSRDTCTFIIRKPSSKFCKILNNIVLKIGLFGGLAVFIIIIVIEKVRQCKAEREWYTPYQSEGKKSRRL